MVSEAGFRHERRQATGFRRHPRLLKLVAMLGAVVLLGACGNAAAGNDAASPIKGAVAPAPVASIESTGLGGVLGKVADITALALAVNSTVSEVEAEKQHVEIGDQLTVIQAQLAALQTAQQQDFEALPA